MNQCTRTEQRPGHETPFRCLLPAGHGIPLCLYDMPRQPGSEKEAVRWTTAQNAAVADDPPFMLAGAG